MDTIQKVLIKAGRKDLAQQYYVKMSTENKIASRSDIVEKKWPGKKIIANTSNGQIEAYILEDGNSLQLVIFKVIISQLDGTETLRILENTRVGLKTKPEFSMINSLLNENKEGKTFEKMWFVNNSRRRDILKNILI
jgi:hypothetical protein